jgi:hypothetical protein
LKYAVLLYDLTSTYFEGQAEDIPKATYGYSRDHRGDCRQVVLALVVPPRRPAPGLRSQAGQRPGPTNGPILTQVDTVKQPNRVIRPAVRAADSPLFGDGVTQPVAAAERFTRRCEPACRGILSPCRRPTFLRVL